MCNKFKTKKDIVFLCFALGFSNRNLTEIYTKLELKSSKSRKHVSVNPSHTKRGSFGAGKGR